jgi:hypothetical protein
MKKIWEDGGLKVTNIVPAAEVEDIRFCKII